MKVKIQKWGNSLAVRIPKPLAEQTSIEVHCTADISVEGDLLIIRPIRSREYSLRELVSGINQKNIHQEVSTGKIFGKESW